MNQIQLSETQSIILSVACARDDGLIFPVTAKIKGGAVGNVCKSLLKRGLIEEIQATDMNTVWRYDEELGSITLRATPLAYSALGITEATEEAPSKTTRTAPTIEQSKGGKQAMLIEMLKRPKGATIQQVVDATGWLPHTVRGAIAGAIKKKLGLNVVSEKIEGVGRVYRIA
ncbi:DUF3489 domain-containing protein [Thalassospira alkalitolerans]|uniref:DUF3489 domain-containing protein n=1 Tax=Thalassospira alkalitolerans TaxID=1293890 RepID=UPI0030EF1EE9|tara:strand:- start:22602 stop:23117 length:516 start_codon:yes stop_codon:yes gene_type:complete